MLIRLLQNLPTLCFLILKEMAQSVKICTTHLDKALLYNHHRLSLGYVINQLFPGVYRGGT